MLLTEARAEQDDSRYDAEYEDVACRHAQHAVEFPSSRYLFHLDVGKVVQGDVDAGQRQEQAAALARQRICHDRGYDDEDGDVAQGAVEAFCIPPADAYHQGRFAVEAVALAVAVVVDDEQRVYRHAASQRLGCRLRRHALQCRCENNIIGAAYGHEAEEEKHQEVAHAVVTEACGVKKTEDDAADAHCHHLYAAKEYEWQSYGASCQCGEGDGALHGLECDPSFGTRPL